MKYILDNWVCIFRPHSVKWYFFKDRKLIEQTTTSLPHPIPFPVGPVEFHMLLVKNIENLNRLTKQVYCGVV